MGAELKRAATSPNGIGRTMRGEEKNKARGGWMAASGGKRGQE